MGQLSYKQNRVTLDLAEVIEKARDMEISRDLEGLENLLSPFWSDFGENPNFDEFEPKTVAEMYRICGYFLSAHGLAKSKKTYQERGKDLLTRAIDLFEKLDLNDEVGKAKSLLAATYYYQGQIEECEIVLAEAALYYENDQLNPVNLMLCLTQIATAVWKNDYQTALEILHKIQIPMELCENPFLLVRYHHQAGMVYSAIGRTSDAQKHYQNAIRCSREMANHRYEALNYNNLANAFVRSGKLDDALKTINTSIESFRRLRDTGSLASAYDTRAQIELKIGALDSAMKSIGKAIAHFEKGDFASGLTDAIWVKIHIMLRLNEKEEAFLLFSYLAGIAKEKIGEYAVKKYATEFSKIVHVKKGTDFFGEVQAFKRDLLMESLVEVDADIDKAAEKLKTKRNEIVHVLNKEFPDIYLDLGITPQAISAENN